jgi:hypothetical protein
MTRPNAAPLARRLAQLPCDQPIHGIMLTGPATARTPCAGGGVQDEHREMPERGAAPQTLAP